MSQTLCMKDLSPKEVAQYLGMAEQTIYRWISKRKIPFYKFGKSVRISLEEINKWTEKKKTPSSFDFKKKF